MSEQGSGNLEWEYYTGPDASSSRRRVPRESDEPRPYVCQYSGCEKTFDRPSALEQHTRTHTGQRPHVCPYCRVRRFATTSNLYRHVRACEERPEGGEIVPSVVRAESSLLRQQSRAESAGSASPPSPAHQTPPRDPRAYADVHSSPPSTERGSPSIGSPGTLSSGPSRASLEREAPGPPRPQARPPNRPGPSPSTRLRTFTVRGLPDLPEDQQRSAEANSGVGRSIGAGGDVGRSGDVSVSEPDVNYTIRSRSSLAEWASTGFEDPRAASIRTSSERPQLQQHQTFPPSSSTSSASSSSSMAWVSEAAPFSPVPRALGEAAAVSPNFRIARQETTGRSRSAIAVPTDRDPTNSGLLYHYQSTGAMLLEAPVTVATQMPVPVSQSNLASGSRGASLSRGSTGDVMPFSSAAPLTAPPNRGFYSTGPASVSSLSAFIPSSSPSSSDIRVVQGYSHTISNAPVAASPPFTAAHSQNLPEHQVSQLYASHVGFPSSSERSSSYSHEIRSSRQEYDLQYSGETVSQPIHQQPGLSVQPRYGIPHYASTSGPSDSQGPSDSLLPGPGGEISQSAQTQYPAYTSGRGNVAEDYSRMGFYTAEGEWYSSSDYRGSPPGRDDGA